MCQTYCKISVGGSSNRCKNIEITVVKSDSDIVALSSEEINQYVTQIEQEKQEQQEQDKKENLTIKNGDIYWA